jgi:hypothetical protein
MSVEYSMFENSYLVMMIIDYFLNRKSIYREILLIE